ncbi:MULTISPECIES: diguanylate cyclase domain-containing protein [Amycolatopsis]|uniref:GGDEF domain-containing protein n=1 Tax=Amycolatopsis bullii TaxID=941987 RepID=A0ABQ3KPI9_9PSEU|nr:diguanylate cyclase [Amycolatopsis bullii]GHG41132.1 hypothetical protein GCM10017567_73270 [Amycolatopsis bullii]
MLLPSLDPADLQDSVITVTASVGAAIFPDHGSNLTTVLLAVDDAVYRSKDRGRDQIVTASTH